MKSMLATILKLQYDDAVMLSNGKKIASINCSRCGSPMLHDVCACGGIKCHIRTGKKDSRIFLDFRTSAPLTLQTAKQVLRHMVTAHEQGTYNALDYNPSSRKEFLIKNQIDKYLEVIKNKVAIGELSLGTLGTYSGHIKHIKRLIGDIDVRDLDRDMLENDLSNKLEMKIESKKGVLRALRGFYTWLWHRPRQEKVIKEIPAWFYPKGNDSTVRKTISVDFAKQALLNIPEEHRDIIEYAMITGLRPGELVTLQIGDHNLADKSVTIQRTISGNKLVEREKERDKEGHKSNISLSDRCIEIYKKHSQGRFAKDFLFINTATGRPYHKTFLSRLWNKHSGTGLDFYACTRHFFCTHVTRILKGDLIKTQKMMRHKDPKSTARYIHIETQELNNTSNDMADLINLSNVIKSKKESAA